jgi:nucleotide-binding universal stress UspA family protein
MNAKKILFPTDFAHSGERALELATALARESGATLLIVYVDEPLPITGEAQLYPPDILPSPQQLLATLKEIVPTDARVTCEHKVLFGKPANQILKTAQEDHVDFIVIPTHARTGLMHLLMGSVAEAVLRRAPCPVLTVKIPSAPAEYVSDSADRIGTQQHRPLGSFTNVRTILIPTDFSSSSRQALEVATSLAQEHRAKLVIVHVMEPPTIYGEGELVASFDDSDVEEARQQLEAVVPADGSLPCEHKLMRGHAAEDILRAAETSGADLIVMGTHGRTGLTHLLMGSVAENIVRKARCPVLTVKQLQTADSPAVIASPLTYPPVP